MANSSSKIIPTDTISVGTPGIYTNESNADISASVNAALAAAPQGEHIELIFNPGDYGETGPILIPSDTSVVGNNATLQYIPELGAPTNWGLLANADAYSENVLSTITTDAGTKVVLTTWPTTPTATGATADVIDNNISVQGMTFIINDAHIFGTWFTNATQIDVQGNTYIGGVDGNAFVNVTDSVVAQNIAVGQNNAPYDNWNGPTNLTIELNADLVFGTTNSGWSVLLNSTPTGDPSNPGNATNDGIIANLFASTVPYSLAVDANALTNYGFTSESNITLQGNTDSMMNIPGQTGILTGDPMYGMTVQDNVFSGLIDNAGAVQYSYAIDITEGTNTSTDSTTNTDIEGNLVAGDESTGDYSAISNLGNDPSTVNNAVIGASTPTDGNISTESTNGTFESLGNISYENGQESGSGVLPGLDVSAPAILICDPEISKAVSALVIDDTNSLATLSVTLITEFGMLSLPSSDTDAIYATLSGQSAILLSGSAQQINQDLAELSYTSNSQGWDDSIEVLATDSLAQLSVRYIPIVVQSPTALIGSAITLTPGEITPMGADPYTLASTISVPDLSNDTVIAASGNSTINMGGSVSVVFLGLGDSTIIGGSSQAYIATGSGNTQINLSADGKVTVAGGAGNATVNALTGNNLIESGVGNTDVTLASSNNTVLGGLGTLSVQANSGALLVETLPQDAGDLSAVLAGGNSTIFALSGNVQITTESPAADILYLGIGDSSISSGGRDIVFTGSGYANINATSGGVPTIYGGTGQLSFIGGSGDAILHPAASTTLTAGPGNLTVCSGGEFLLNVSNLGETNRTIILPSLGDDVVLSGFAAGGIGTEYLNNNTLDVGLSDGSEIQIPDPSKEFIASDLGTLGFVADSFIQGTYAINVDALPSFVSGQTASSTSMIAKAMSAAPAGEQIIVIANGSSDQGLVIDGTLSLDPTNMTIQGPLNGTGVLDIESDSNLNISGSVASTETIVFQGANNELLLGDSTEFYGTILGISTTSVIDLANVPFNSLETISVVNGNLLQLAGSGPTVSLKLGGSQPYTGAMFHIFSDGLSGTDVSEGTVPCLLSGSMISTPDGDIPVEKLKIGDLVLSDKGNPVPIKWIGRRSYSTPMPDNSDIMPVVIKASALADNVPDRDLYISPKHGLKIGGVIVPAGALVNGVSVVRADDLAHISYFHIEMECHEIIRANNTAVETFIDFNSRGMFDNFDEFYLLYKHEIGRNQEFCFPRVEHGHRLEAIRRLVEFRAGISNLHGTASDVVGTLEIADRQTVVGWAFDRKCPNAPLVLELLNCSEVIAITVANIDRPDVRRAGYRSERCGFSISLPAPLPALRRHEISVRVHKTKVVLDGCPIVIDPALSHDLIKMGGLQAILEATEKCISSPDDRKAFGNSLQQFGSRVLGANGINTRTAALSQTISSARHEKAILFLDENWPTVTLDAGSNAVVSHMEAFQDMGYDVIFCATSGAADTNLKYAGYKTLLEKGIECFGHDGMVAEAMIKILAPRRLDFVYLHRFIIAAQYASLIRQNMPNTKIMFSVADLHHLRLSRQAIITDRPELARDAKAVRDAELWAMRLSDCVLTHSRFELGVLKNLLPKANVHLATWAITPTTKLINLKMKKDIAFIGGANHAPNVDAVKHLIRDIMPLVWANHPEIKCYIIGADWCGPDFANADRRICFLGHQPNLRTHLNAVRLTVAPLRFGAGIKGKVLESFAAGVPCVMTKIASEGLPLDGHLQSSVADGLNFAKTVVDLYSDAKILRILAQSGIDMIETHFSKERVVEAFLAATGTQRANSRLDIVA